jgi:hypothetical protein
LAASINPADDEFAQWRPHWRRSLLDLITHNALALGTVRTW